MKYHTEKRDLPAISCFMVHRGPRTVFVVVDEMGQESWECATPESADFRCAALNFDSLHGSREAEIMVTDFLDRAMPKI